MRSPIPTLLAGACIALAMLACPPALAQSAANSLAAGQLVLPSPTDGSRPNPTMRTVSLTVPLRDGGVSRGDVLIDIDPDGSVRVSAERVVELLSTMIDKGALAQLRARGGSLTVTDLAAAGVTLRYNAQELALDLELAAARRASRSLIVADLEPATIGEFLEPAQASAFVNFRGNADYLHGDGLQTPVIYVDGAARVGRIVAESEGLWQPGGDGPALFRAGSRLVFDDRERLMRWTAGDLQPVGRGFQSLPEIAGLSLFRSYSVLEPQRIARPRGDRAFTLTRPSSVEVQVNGLTLRRLQLDAGNYDLRDFPFTQGANDIRLLILDDAGRRQVLNFNVFLDQQQLGEGLTEFGVYAGVLASTGLRGPEYSNEPAASAFVRRGISERLTLGANLQGDRRSQMGGLEALWSSPIGTVSGSFALSHLRDRGAGHAAIVTFQRLSQRADGGAEALNLFVERRSKDFGALGTVDPSNIFTWEAGGGYSRSLTESLSAGIDGRYSRGRGSQPNIYNARGTAAYRLTDTISVAGEARLEHDGFERRLSGLLTATMRLGRFSSLRGEYDTRFDRARLSYSTFRGHGVGAYNLQAELDRSRSGSGMNVTANYFANRAELGFSHYGSFENLFSGSLSQRTALRAASSIGFADGTVSVGRPIYDSFALVRGHRSLKGASIEVERTPFGYLAETGRLGTAIHPSLPSYLDRTVTIDAPEAPATADLGQGAFRLFPPYRSGYLLTVGSAFNVAAVGRLLNSSGEPVALASGTVRPIGKSEPEPQPIFTNRDGRFGATGLAAGRWQIEMNDEAKSKFVLDIVENAEGVVTVGELRPTPGAE